MFWQRHNPSCVHWDAQLGEKESIEGGARYTAAKELHEEAGITVSSGNFFLLPSSLEHSGRHVNCGYRVVSTRARGAARERELQSNDQKANFQGIL